MIMSAPHIRVKNPNSIKENGSGKKQDYRMPSHISYPGLPGFPPKRYSIPKNF